MRAGFERNHFALRAAQEWNFAGIGSPSCLRRRALWRLSKQSGIIVARMKQSEQVDDTEQSQESTEPPHVHSRSELDAVHEAASLLIERLAGVADGDMVGEIVANALK